MIVQVSEDWLVLTVPVVSVFELLDEPTLLAPASVQLIDVARVASFPFGRSACELNVTLTVDNGVFPKSLLPTV